MKAAIYDPYLDSLGGGERYALAFGLALSKVGWSIDLAWKSPKIKAALEDRFGFDLSGINVVKDIRRGDGYDLCFWISDGSIPSLLARKNFLHFQVPFHGVNGKTLLNRMKLFRINKVICNSSFTKRFIDEEYGVKSIVIYPPVETEKIRPGRKENIILYVGRFSALLQSKRQDVLVKAFKTFVKNYPDWKLVLAGGVEVGSEKLLKKLEKLSRGAPIGIVKSPSFKEIKRLYATSKIFWSASGFGINETKNPEKVEHFGITTVEAMAAKCVPIVFAAGGAKEIVKDGVDGFLWGTTRDLLRKTKKLLSTRGLMTEVSLRALESSSTYSYERFEKEVIGLI